MSYADKCFVFDWGNRMIKTEPQDLTVAGNWEKISLRKRSYYEGDDYKTGISIELWGAQRADGTRLDGEVVMTRENALLLASKLVRAVNELDLDDQTYLIRKNIEELQELHSDDVGCIFSAGDDPRGGIDGIIGNFLNTPMGQDYIKKMDKRKEDE